MRKFTLALFLFAPCMHAACGSERQDSATQPHRARATIEVLAWDSTETLKQHKQQIVDTLRSLGANDARISLVLACAMAESIEISAGQRDASKDGAGMAKNFSAFNMNAFALQKLGWQEGSGVDLNQDANLASAVKLFNQGMEAMGENRWLCLHRGGETAYNDGVSYGAQDYIRTVRAIADHLSADKSRWLDAKRYGCVIAHV